jgi:hypothetical protein
VVEMEGNADAAVADVNITARVLLVEMSESDIIG